jgi:hypothetical protein
MMNDNGSLGKFNRFELKYLLSLLQAEHLRAALQGYVVPDEHGHSNGRYTLSSLYYDSPDLRCYWENEHGLKFRRKLRIRRCETCEVFTDESPVFLEIKQRYDRQAFTGTRYDPGLRVTFDTSLSFQARQLHLHEQPSGLPMLAANSVWTPSQQR